VNEVRKVERHSTNRAKGQDSKTSEKKENRLEKKKTSLSNQNIALVRSRKRGRNKKGKTKTLTNAWANETKENWGLESAIQRRRETAILVGVRGNNSANHDN